MIITCDPFREKPVQGDFTGSKMDLPSRRGESENQHNGQTFRHGQPNGNRGLLYKKAARHGNFTAEYGANPQQAFEGVRSGWKPNGDCVQ